MHIASQPARRARLKDIAETLGLSVNTVSRALAGKDAVGEQTRTRIQAEAERLGYVPNAIARSLAVGSAMALGLVITNPSNPFYTTLIFGNRAPRAHARLFAGVDGQRREARKRAARRHVVVALERGRRDCRAGSNRVGALDTPSRGGSAASTRQPRPAAPGL